MKKDFPFISLLLAVRNEENVILKCLNAISRLDYPSDKIEVLIGNDSSTDTSLELIETFAKPLPHFNVYTITKQIGALNGKANVLAQLAQKAKGELFLITDADVVVPPTWAKYMVSSIIKNPRIGIISGITIPNSNRSFISCFEAIDWLLVLVSVSLASKLGFAITSPGNNMLIRKTAYQAVGGFEATQNAITEDYAILKLITQKKWHFKGLTSKNIFAKTVGSKSYKALLSQRKRWLKGAIQSSPKLKLLVWVVAVIPSFLLVASLVSLNFFYFVFLARWIILYFYLIAILLHYRQYKLLLLLPFYELYQLTFTTVLAFSYLNSKAVIWKGRDYS